MPVRRRSRRWRCRAASFDVSSSSIQTSGTIDQLAAGHTDTDDMTVALTLDAAGVNTVTTAIDLASDDGQGDITPLPMVVQDARTTTDTLTAGGIDQTLTGDGGKLTMTGATAANSETTFKDTAALFKGDHIQNVMVGDLIDVTGLGFSSVGTGAGQTSLGLSGGPLTVSVGGVQKTAVALTGSYNLNDFTLGPDSAGGTLIGYHA